MIDETAPILWSDRNGGSDGGSDGAVGLCIMKKLSLALLLFLLKPLSALAPILPFVFCIGLTLTAVGGVIYIYSTCPKERAYCGRYLNSQGNPEGSYQCLVLQCKRDAEVEGFHIDSGPHKGLKNCYVICETSNYPPVVNLSAQLIHFETSTNLVDWYEFDARTLDPECFDECLTNKLFSPDSPHVFYRGRID